MKVIATTTEATSDEQRSFVDRASAIQQTLLLIIKTAIDGNLRVLEMEVDGKRQLAIGELSASGVYTYGVLFSRLDAGNVKLPESSMESPLRAIFIDGQGMRAAVLSAIFGGASVDDCDDPDCPVHGDAAKGDEGAEGKAPDGAVIH